MREVAEMSGLGLSHVSNMESGNSMSADALYLVCEALDVSMDWVME